MGSELELTVTITYEGPKSRIETAEEAVPIVRQDLTTMGIPHPKKDNVSVVYPGTVRFFWVALRNSLIRKTLINGIEPRDDTGAHRELLRNLSIKSIDLRESPASTSNGSSSKKSWKPPYRPDAGSYATPISLQNSPNPDQFLSGSYGRSPMDVSLQPKAEYPGARTSLYERNLPPPETKFRVKLEPVADTIPPPLFRTPRQDGELDMEIDTPSPFRDARKPLDRSRYKHIPDFSPRDPPEIQTLRRELRDIRQQLSADIAHERTIIEKLRELGTDVDSNAVEMDFVTRARLEHLEEELQAERDRRKRLEGVIEDIRRERREPFVVPALLDAFIEISKLTNDVLEEG